MKLGTRIKQLRDIRGFSHTVTSVKIKDSIENYRFGIESSHDSGEILLNSLNTDFCCILILIIS